jgi:predicted N-acetyltransferase YhbS
VKEGITIRDLRPDDDIPAITALLHESYAPLAASGLRFLASHQDDGTTRRRLQSGDPLVATFAGRIAGTITLYAPAPDSPASWYRRPGVFRIGQLAVRPDMQRQGIGLCLVQAAQCRARERGATDLALDTAEGAQHLRSWYERLGFRFVEFVSWHDTNYRSVIMSKCLTTQPAG